MVQHPNHQHTEHPAPKHVKKTKQRDRLQHPPGLLGKNQFGATKLLLPVVLPIVGF